MADLPIGLAIRKVRDSRRIAQSQVARSMGCPRTYISKVENGRAHPNLEQFVRLCDAMNAEPWRVLRFMSKLRDQLESGPQQKKEDSPVCPGNVSAAVAKNLSKVQPDSVEQTTAETISTKESVTSGPKPLRPRASSSAPSLVAIAKTVMGTASASAAAQPRQKKNEEAA